jgi:hypothetical protein
VNASTADVSSINSSFKDITDTASTTAKALGGEMYNSGIKAAQGLVDGLLKKQGVLEKAMKALAKAMTKAMKKELGIHSPSRVFAELGGHTGQGLVNGLLDTRADVMRASQVLAQAAIPVMPSAPRRAYDTGQDQVTPAALQGGTRAGASVTFQFVTHNPQAEPESVTTNKALNRVAALGLV